MVWWSMGDVDLELEIRVNKRGCNAMRWRDLPVFGVPQVET